MVAGGDFQAVPLDPPLPADGIAAFDPAAAAWSNLGPTGFSDRVYSFIRWDPDGVFGSGDPAWEVVETEGKKPAVEFGSRLSDPAPSLP